MLGRLHPAIANGFIVCGHSLSAGARLKFYALYSVIMSDCLTGAYKATPTFRLRCYVFLAVVGAEMEPATTRKMTKVYLHDNEIAVMIVWVFVDTYFKNSSFSISSYLFLLVFYLGFLDSPIRLFWKLAFAFF